MLTVEKKITLTGGSHIGGAIAENYKAEIDSGAPENMTLTSYQVDKATYKANRETCRADRAAFEDAAYTLQEEMMTEKNEAE